MRDYKYESSLNQHGFVGEKFKVLVVSVDHNETINDDNKTPKLGFITPTKDNRNFHLSGFRVDGRNTPIMDIIVPPQVNGDFQIPKEGDVVWCTQATTGVSSDTIYLYAEYSNGDTGLDTGNTSVPLWGSQHGDYGHLRTYKDHNQQFANFPFKKPNAIVAKTEGTFRSKWVRSIEGYRWRDYYKGNINDNKFAVRGDNVFDLDKTNMGLEVVEEDGVEILADTKQSKYPEPNNVPEIREKDEVFTYVKLKHEFMKVLPSNSLFETESVAIPDKEYTTLVHKTKNYFSYEPLLDKTYKKKTKGFERELISVKEYSLVFSGGNNKLMYQDAHGDGEQVLITLKNQYDAGYTIVHNKDKSQIRIRDHLGQSILIEGDPDRPRIVLVTKDKRTIEVGSIKGKGGFVYLRNGSAFGDSDVPWGRKTGKTKDSVFNQEFLMVDNQAVISDADFKDRLSAGLSGLLVGPGIYHRTVDDSKGEYEKAYSSYEYGGVLFETSLQSWKSTNTSVKSMSKVTKSQAEWSVIGTENSIEKNRITFNSQELLLKRIEGHYVKLGAVVDVHSNTVLNLSANAAINLIAPAIDHRPG